MAELSSQAGADIVVQLLPVGVFEDKLGQDACLVRTDGQVEKSRGHVVSRL